MMNSAPSTPSGQIVLLLYALLATPSATAANENCWQDLHALTLERQLACLQQDHVGSPTSQDLIGLLSESEASTDHRVVAGLLDNIRAHQDADTETAERLVDFLPHQHPIYQDRDRWHVIRLRAYLIATLADIGFPDSGLPLLADSLVFVDERVAAVEVGSAVHAAGTLGAKGRQFLPYMLRMLSTRFAEEEFSLLRYESDFPSREATTVQLEVIQTAERIGHASDQELLATLRAIADSPTHSPLEPRVIAAARQALHHVEQRIAESALPDQPHTPVGLASSMTPWRSRDDRPVIDVSGIRLTDQDGMDRILGELIDRPVLLIFFYTRCQNAGKCSTAVSRLAYLQRELQKAGIDHNARLLALTFEPAFDTPERLKRFVQDRGLLLGEFTLTGRIHEIDHNAFIRELDIPVSYSAGWVNTHGVEAVLLDAEGRLARKYTATGLTFDQVAQDLENLNAGSPGLVGK